MDLTNNQNQQIPDKDYLSKKQQREKDATARKNKKILNNLMLWGGTIAAIGLVAFGLYETAKKEAANAPGEFFPAQSRDHIKVGDKHDAYNSNPPTGGWHYEQPAQSGVYDQELPDENLIHNLEHGHIWISYRPDLDKDSISNLAELAISYGSKIIMTPRAKNDSPIVLASWEYLQKYDKVNETTMRAFIDYHRGHGPEDIMDFGFQDFRGKPLPSLLGPMVK